MITWVEAQAMQPFQLTISCEKQDASSVGMARAKSRLWTILYGIQG